MIYCRLKLSINCWPLQKQRRPLIFCIVTAEKRTAILRNWWHSHQSDVTLGRHRSITLPIRSYAPIGPAQDSSPMLGCVTRGSRNIAFAMNTDDVVIWFTGKGWLHHPNRWRPRSSPTVTQMTASSVWIANLRGDSSQPIVGDSSVR
jgi:hypothetical protein